MMGKLIDKHIMIYLEIIGHFAINVSYVDLKTSICSRFKVYRL